METLIRWVGAKPSRSAQRLVGGLHIRFQVEAVVSEIRNSGFMKWKIWIVQFLIWISVSDAMAHDIQKRTLLEPVNIADLKFQDGEKSVGLDDLFLTGKPVVFFLIYYKCPSICNTQLNSFFKSVKELDLTPGKEFEMAVLSFDHKETPELALKKKNAYIQEFEKSGKKADFRFLTGTRENIQAITDSLRFSFYWSEKENQWVHPVGAYVYTKEGRFFRKIGGTVFEPKTVYYTLAEIDQNIMKSHLDKMKLYFSRYEQMTGDYKLNVDRIFNIVMPLFMIISGAIIFSRLYKIFKNKKYING